MRTKLFILSLVILLALSACGPAVTGTAKTISVTGNGTVYVTPDVAYIYIGVHTEDYDVSQAVSKNNTLAQAVVDALRNSGVAANDLQTSNFSVWSYQSTDPMTGMNTGLLYSVDNQVFVTVRDLTRLAELLDTAISAAANNINSVSFDVADKTATMTEARRLAMENAASLAGELSQTAGVSLGDIQNITYTEYVDTYYGYGMGGGGGAEGAASTPINPGQVKINVTVNVTYGIK
jgi:hypothetical protein